MDVKRFDGMARLVFVAITRRRLTRLLTGFGVSTTLAPLFADEVGASKKCGPCRTKKNGECKKKRPNGTRCRGGACFRGLCNPGCCGAGCATRCAADEVCADPPGQRCGPNCASCADPCGCAATFDTEIGFCFNAFDRNTVCAAPECNSQGDCAPNGFCTHTFCDESFVRRCLDSCPA
jgi:hypothetical protein